MSNGPNTCTTMRCSVIFVRRCARRRRPDARMTHGSSGGMQRTARMHACFGLCSDSEASDAELPAARSLRCTARGGGAWAASANQRAARGARGQDLWEIITHPKLDTVYTCHRFTSFDCCWSCDLVCNNTLSWGKVLKPTFG